MRYVTSLFAALMLAGALANAARAQAPAASTGTTGTYSAFGPYSTRATTGTYSVFGPYSTRYSSSSNPSPTSTDSSLRSGGTQTAGKGNGQGDDARPEAGRATSTGGGPRASRPRYVRIGVAGNAIQSVVVP